MMLYQWIASKSPVVSRRRLDAANFLVEDNQRQLELLEQKVETERLNFGLQLTRLTRRLQEETRVLSERVADDTDYRKVGRPVSSEWWSMRPTPLRSSSTLGRPRPPSPPTPPPPPPLPPHPSPLV